MVRTRECRVCDMPVNFAYCPDDGTKLTHIKDAEFPQGVMWCRKCDRIFEVEQKSSPARQTPRTSRMPLGWGIEEGEMEEDGIDVASRDFKKGATYKMLQLNQEI